MRKVIGGKVYDTDTATKVCDLRTGSIGQGDFRYEETSLYKSPKGTYFLAGTGGPMTRWAQSDGDGSRRGGSGLHVLDEADARGICERNGTTEQFIAAFGEPEEG